jgi:hypothetical protein
LVKVSERVKAMVRLWVTVKEVWLEWALQKVRL